MTRARLTFETCSKVIQNRTRLDLAASRTKKTIEKSKAQLMSSISTIYSKIDKGLKDMVDTTLPPPSKEPFSIDPKKFKKLEFWNHQWAALIL